MVQLKQTLVQLVALTGQKAVVGVESLGTLRAVRIVPASPTDRLPTMPAEPTPTDSDNPGPSGFMPDGHRAGRPVSTGSLRSRCLPRTAIRRASGPRAKRLARGSRIRRGLTADGIAPRIRRCRMSVA